MDVLKNIANAVKLDVTAAAESQFFLDVGGVPDGTFSVYSFSAEDHALGRNYRFRIRVGTEADIAPADIIGARARLLVRWDAEPVYVHGQVRDYTNVGTDPERQEYELILIAPLALLELHQHDRVFLGRRVPEIIEAVLTGAGFSTDDFAFDLSEDYPTLEYVVQYEESDWDFLQRLMTRNGIFFRHQQQEESVQIVFHDSVASLPLLPGTGRLVFQAQTGEVREVESAFALRHQARLRTDGHHYRDVNYRTPEANLQSRAANATPIPGHGDCYTYGANFKTTQEGERICRVAQEAEDWQRETVILETDCRGLAPGYRFTLDGHPDAALNGDYLVVDVDHRGEQRHAFAMGTAPEGMTYRNKALLIRAGVPFRLPPRSPRRIQGVITARIESTGGEYAYLDELGRYRIRLPFDLSETPAGEASHPVRMMQPYGGRDWGMHFPLHAGTEVVVGCVNGDIDRPFIMGAIPTAEAVSPVTSANASENRLRTWGGNELLMDDRKGQEKIELHTRDRKNILTLDANAEGHRVRLATEEGEMEAYAARSMILECGDSQQVQVGADHLVTVENRQQLMTKQAEIELQAATDLLLKAGDNLRFQAEEEDASIEAGDDMILDVGETLSMTIRNEDLEVNAVSGAIELSAAKAITVRGEGGGTLHIGQAGAAIEISRGGDLVISGKAVNISGQAITVTGQSIGSN